MTDHASSLDRLRAKKNDYLRFFGGRPSRGLQGRNCNLTILDCLMAGPVRKLWVSGPVVLV